jgi:hypothetical protein
MNSLSKGILLEDSKEFLSWGESLNDIKSRLNGKKIDEGDRIIYQWGEHTIFNGLKVSLSTTCLKTMTNLFNHKLYSIQSWTIGDEKATSEYSRISKHLVKTFGNPSEKDESSFSERDLIWIFDKTTVCLSFFEQHCFKLVLTISRKK